MRIDLNLPLWRGLVGGILAGFGLLYGFYFLMPLSIALLWSASRNIVAAGIWGISALLLSHQWLLALHPLTWIGIPEAFSFLITLFIWIFCGTLSGGLVACWALILNLPFFASLRRGSLREKFLCATLLSSLWGLSEVLLAKMPLFWIGIGGSVLPGNIALAGLARWFGAGGLAFIQFLSGFWLWQIFILFRKGLDWKKFSLIGLLCFLLLHIVGWNLLNKDYTTQPLKVGFWQPNIPIREKFNNKQQKAIPLLIDDAINKADNISASLLVAPEGTLQLNQYLVNRTPIPFLTGGFRWDKGKQKSSLLVFEPNQKEYSHAIDKHRLVPLGEWLPSIFDFLGPGLSAVGGLEPGQPSRFLKWSGPPIATAICYELSDGNSIINAVELGAEWILAIANLDPYPLVLQKQFISIAKLRSIESLRDLIVVSNRGPSGLVSYNGEFLEGLPSFVEGVSAVNLHLNNNKSGYSIWKEIPLLTTLSVSLFSLFLFNHKD